MHIHTTLELNKLICSAYMYAQYVRLYIHTYTYVRMYMCVCGEAYMGQC